MYYSDQISTYSISKDVWNTERIEKNVNVNGHIVNVNGEILNFGAYQPSSNSYPGAVYRLVSSEEKLSILLDVGETAQLSLFFNLQNNVDYTWVSTDSSVASVDTNGVVTGVAEGRCQIYVQGSDGYEDFAYVKVLPPEPERLLALHLFAGESKRLWLRDDPLEVNWVSEDESVALVDAQGRVTGVAQGICKIIGEVDGDTYGIYCRVAGF